jgi:flagellar motility protein MotE (MotC chaperone)
VSIGRLRLLPLTICVLALLLAVKSALFVRVIVGAGEVVGQTVLPAAQAAGHEAAGHEPAKASAPPVAAAAPPVEPKPPQDPPISDSERVLLQELRQRREQLEAREAGLAAREAVLGATERKLSGRVDELQALQKKLEAIESARIQREDAGWQGLVKVYETMKPRDAANIMNELDMPVLLQVLDRMKEAKAAPILSAMQPNRAREVTDGLAHLRVRDPAIPRDRG